MEVKLMITTSLEDFEEALRAGDAVAVAYRHHICSCTIGEAEAQRFRQVIRDSDVPIIGLFDCEAVGGILFKGRITVL